MVSKRKHFLPAEVQYPGSNRAFLLRQHVVGRNKSNACTMQSKDITVIATKAASYEELQLGNNIFV
jgi:hypothetical protein